MICDKLIFTILKKKQEQLLLITMNVLSFCLNFII